MHRWMMRCFALALLSAGCGWACASSASTSSDSHPTAARCAKDADCRLFSDYCDGCACRALAAGEAEPPCKGTLVQCLVDPCQGKQAACGAGACTTAPAAK